MLNNGEGINEEPINYSYVTGSVTIRRETGKYNFVEFMFTGTVFDAYNINNLMEEKFPATEIPEISNNGAGKAYPTCPCGELSDERTSKKTGKKYFVCPKCGKYSFDGSNWNNPTPR